MFGRLRSLRLMGALFATLCSLASAGFAATAMQDYVTAMQPGWNLGNTLDAMPDETSWGNPRATPALLQQISAQGFKSIRLPVTWSRHMGAAPSYTVDAAWMNRVQEVVDASLAAGFYVMLNIHHDSWDWAEAMPTKHDAVLAQYRALWTQIAARFRDYPAKLMFESINEPSFKDVSDATKMSLLDELNTEFFHIVRDSGGANTTRPLVLPTVATNASQAFVDSLSATMAKFNDTNLIATVHYYGFWPFSVNIAGNTRFDADASNDIRTALDTVSASFVARGIPVVIGEYGLLAFDSDKQGIERGEMLKYFEYFTQYVRTKAIAHMLWDNGQHFDRATYQWRDPELYAVIKQGLTGRSSTTDNDFVFLANGATVADAVFNLNLNGNTFVSLYDGSTPLTSGSDYSLDGSKLTIKSSALSRYATGAYGEKTAFTVNFSSGPAWKIHVRYVAPPELKAATLSPNTTLAIPATFNGDLVSTMEAVYTTGGNAGPQNWTSYKEFGVTFSPDYANGTLTIKKKFFDETTAGKAIEFTFHFWSGRTVKYQFSGASGSSTGGNSGNADNTTPSPTPSTPPSSPATAPASSGGGGGGGAPSVWFFAALAAATAARVRRRTA